MKEHKKVRTIYLSDEVAELLSKVATKQQRSNTQVVNLLLLHYLPQHLED